MRKILIIIINKKSIEFTLKTLAFIIIIKKNNNNNNTIIVKE